MKSGVSLQQMLTEVKRQSESKEDYLIAPNRLRMESYGKEMFLHLSDDSGTELIEPMTITGIAHRQIGTHLRIPAENRQRHTGNVDIVDEAIAIAQVRAGRAV